MSQYNNYYNFSRIYIYICIYSRSYVTDHNLFYFSPCIIINHIKTNFVTTIFNSRFSHAYLSLIVSSCKYRARGLGMMCNSCIAKVYSSV